MKYGSVCSGIEAASVAWHPLGWRAAFLSEIESFPRAVLTHHYPDVPLHGDFTTIEAGQYDAIDLLVGGTPCQSFSVAGLRGGLADDRGNLALEYLRLADRLRPKWLVWENVPGVLSSNGGRDFGAILGGMVELGYGIAYRVLDAQFFGVPQRRRRVFVVGYFGDWRRAAAVLFERHSLQGHPAPRREAGEDVAPTISARPTGGGGLGTDFDCDGGLIASLDLNNMGGGGNIGWHAPSEPSITLDTNANVGIAHSSHASSRQADAYSKLRSLREAIGAEAFAEWGLGISDPFRAPEVLRSDLHGESVRCQANEGGRGLDDGPLSRAARDSGGPVSDVRQAGRERRAPSGRGLSEQFARELEAALSKLSHEGSSTERLLRALRCAGEGAGVLQQALPPIQGRSAVRRVTPREAERLQGFPDDWTLVTHRNKLAADGPRYKALGNSMAVPCMRWIGERIHSVELLTSLREAA